MSRLLLSFVKYWRARHSQAFLIFAFLLRQLYLVYLSDQLVVLLLPLFALKTWLLSFALLNLQLCLLFCFLPQVFLDNFENSFCFRRFLFAVKTIDRFVLLFQFDEILSWFKRLICFWRFCRKKALAQNLFSWRACFVETMSCGRASPLIIAMLKLQWLHLYFAV